MSGPFSHFRQRPAAASPPGDAEPAAPGGEQPTEVIPAVDGPGVQANPEEPPVAAPEAAETPSADAAAGATAETPDQAADAVAAGEGPEAGAVPAGAELPAPGKLSFRDRGRLRRRLRFLRRVRELGFRDLGGLVFDQHRFSHSNPQLVEGKLAALHAVDGELRAIEHALAEQRPIAELREPGITACVRCGAVHGSEARFCPSCGVALRGPRAVAEVGDAVSPLGVPAPAPAQPPADLPPWAAPGHPTPPGPQ